MFYSTGSSEEFFTSRLASDVMFTVHTAGRQVRLYETQHEYRKITFVHLTFKSVEAIPAYIEHGSKGVLTLNRT